MWKTSNATQSFSGVYYLATIRTLEKIGNHPAFGYQRITFIQVVMDACLSNLVTQTQAAMIVRRLKVQSGSP